MAIILYSATFQCQPEFFPCMLNLQNMATALENFENDHKVIGEEGEISCLATNTEKNNLVTYLLTEMAHISVQYTFNRACYPLPSGSILEVDV